VHSKPNKKGGSKEVVILSQNPT